jgi:hypothetical protein
MLLKPASPNEKMTMAVMTSVSEKPVVERTQRAAIIQDALGYAGRVYQSIEAFLFTGLGVRKLP